MDLLEHVLKLIPHWNVFPGSDCFFNRSDVKKTAKFYQCRRVLWIIRKPRVRRGVNSLCPSHTYTASPNCWAQPFRRCRRSETRPKFRAKTWKIFHVSWYCENARSSKQRKITNFWSETDSIGRISAIWHPTWTCHMLIRRFLIRATAW